MALRKQQQSTVKTVYSYWIVDETRRCHNLAPGGAAADLESYGDVSPNDVLNSPRSEKGFVLSLFSRGDRVHVSEDFFWAKGAKGTVSAAPDAVTNLSGAWDQGLTRQEVSAVGTHTVYWIWFDEPQFDADGDGPYSGGQVWESALSLLTDRPN